MRRLKQFSCPLLPRTSDTAQETLSCSIEGDDAEIAFNFAYVLDGLSSVSSDSVYLEVGTSREPGIFKAEAPEKFLYLVMPVRIS